MPEINGGGAADAGVCVGTATEVLGGAGTVNRVTGVLVARRRVAVGKLLGNEGLTVKVGKPELEVRFDDVSCVALEAGVLLLKPANPLWAVIENPTWRVLVMDVSGVRSKPSSPGDGTADETPGSVPRKR